MVLRRLMERRAYKGMNSLALMTDKLFPKFLADCSAFHGHSGESRMSFPKPPLTVQWIEQVWTYISAHRLDVMDSLSTVALLPDIDKAGRGFLHRPDGIFIAATSPGMTSLPELVGGALDKLGVVHLKYVPDYVMHADKIAGLVVQYPTVNGIKKVLEQTWHQGHVQTSAKRFNAKASKTEKVALVKYLSRNEGGEEQFPHGAMCVLQKLQLFLDMDNVPCCVEEVKILACSETLPVPYPQRCIQYSPSRNIALSLGCNQQSFHEVCYDILRRMVKDKTEYSNAHATAFMEFLMENDQIIFQHGHIKSLASQLKFLSSREGRKHQRASDLFDPDDPILKELFHQEDKFPANRHVRTSKLKVGLKLIGLKGEAQVSEGDVVNSAHVVAANRCNDDGMKKIGSLISFLDRNVKHLQADQMTELQKLQIIPCIQKKPSGFPASLPFRGGSCASLLQSREVFSSRFINVVGSVHPVAVEMTGWIENLFGLIKDPPLHLVIEHLQHLSVSYQSEKYQSYLGLLNDIYQYLDTLKDDSKCVDLVKNVNSVWVGIKEGFQRPSSVYINASDSDLALKPYRFPLPTAQWKLLMEKLGCHQNQTMEMLIEVLMEIKEKHDTWREAKSKRPADVQKDMQLIIQILNVLKSRPTQSDRLCLPTHQEQDDFLVMIPLEQCTYCNADWLKNQMSIDGDDAAADDDGGDDDDIFYVHMDISQSTAQQLGVSSLTDRVMDDTDDFNMDYHQSEPLTRRLKNLLNEYTDGFSVPKELIQNAEDAGATEVCFMYDERYNLDARTYLINENMADLQGPALWAYNNEVFKPSDFDNITKLSGATKEADTTKVGKFGLGFNSVYNLTDVPSFVSGNQLVIFDPHKTHLGKAGMKANLKSVKNQRMLKKMSGQFKPFNGIFGCNMKKGRGTEPVCAGTLFRFPLRTEQQASTSEIKDLSYSKHEMEKFLKVFADSCGNLLIFTQSVCSVKFFYLPPDGDPENPQLMLHVKKDRLKQQTSDNSAVYQHNVLLHAAREWKKKNGLSVTETCDVQISIQEGTIVDKLKLKTGKNSVTWNIAWEMGTEESAKFARSGKLQGLIPLAAVAIPVGSESGQCTVLVSKSPEGFYKKGHLFCFLPLPIETPFQVHINAAFALTSDRRQLCTRTTDDKKMHEAVWNEALEKDAVSRAFVSAFAGLQIDQSEDIDKYYQLWPTAGQTYSELVKSFYGLIIEENEPIFVHPEDCVTKKTSFHAIRILDPEIRSCRQIGDIAFNAAVHYWDESEAVVDVPTAILESFEDTERAEEIHSRYISVYSFFESVFLPHISDSYWSAADRDKLTVYAINSRDPAIRELLKDSDCIPTKPSGKLKRPSELVHPEGQCAPLYTESEECFPDQNFRDPPILNVLCNLGMVHNDLPSEALLDRANSVIHLHKQHPDNAVKRYRKIMEYISKSDYSSKNVSRTVRIQMYPDSIKEQLKDIPFIPVKQRSRSWPLPWKADDDTKHLARASDLFSDDVLHLVGCSELVIDDYSLEQFKETLKSLGLKTKCDIKIDTATNQLLCLTEEMKNQTKETVIREIKKVALSIYDYLDDVCKTSDDTRCMIRDGLSERAVVLVGDEVLHPQHVAFILRLDLSPYLFRLDGQYSHCKALFSTLGVKTIFDCNDIFQVIKDITTNTELNSLSDNNLKCYGMLSFYLVEHLSNPLPEELPDLLLPDQGRYLKLPSSLCFDDYEFVANDDSMNFVHEDIHQKVAKLFGVKGKREADLKKHRHYFSAFGQSEALTSRLKRILLGYNCDSGIMKELLQNADDSGATELMFIKDFRSLPTEKVFCENWESIQGPALCVYNNSYFSESDFEGIQKLGEGSKSNDPMKTGQYGVGFNAVYHLTDVPSFMTVGPGVEKTICALDPHMKYVTWAEDKQPGGRIKNLDDLRTNYKDAFDGYLEDSISLDTKGTLFRFPLRTSDMAKESKICNKEITTEKVDTLLKQFKEEMFESLLFLHSVKKITISRIEDDGSLVEEYSVECKMDEKDTVKQKGYLEHLQTQANNVKDYSTGVGLGDISLLEAQLTLHIQDTESIKQDWLVVHQSGFSREKELPETLVTSWDRGDIRLLPRGGVAVPLPSDTSSSTFHGKAFCILPLPVETGLPVHINGHFALDHEARRNLLTDGSDYRTDWNKHLVEALIITAYISAIQALKSALNCTIESKMDALKENLARYYSYFPDVSKYSDEFWGRLAKCFYSELVQRRTSLFSVIKPVNKAFSDIPADTRQSFKGKVSWVPVTVRRGFPGYFNNLEEYFKVEKKQFKKSGLNLIRRNRYYIRAPRTSDINKRLLSEILRDLNMKVIEAPLTIYENFVDSDQTDHVQRITPDIVFKFLKSHNDEALDTCMVGPLPKNIQQTPFKSISTLKIITDFIKKSREFESDICGLPLGMTLSQKICVFSGDEPLIVTKFTDLLMKTPAISIHGDLVPFYQDITASSTSLKPFTIEMLASLLPQLVDAELLNTGSPVEWDDSQQFPSKEWIMCLWTYLEDELLKKSDVPERYKTKSWFRDQLATLETWCLFPAKNGHENCQSILYPIEKAGQVIDLYNVDKECAAILTKMKMHCLDDSLLGKRVAHTLAANWKEADTILSVMSSMDLFACDQLIEGEAVIILDYFCKHIDEINKLPDACDKLRNLPFYATLTGKMVPIGDTYAAASFYMIPKDGIQQWTLITRKQLIKHQDELDTLYKYMRVEVLQPLQLYSRLLIPMFDYLPYADRAAHLEVIRNYLMRTGIYNQEEKDLIKQLKNLAFIQTQDGTLHRASDFYSNKEPVFATMCPPSAFLPHPYNEDVWHSFLVLIGLQCNVTVEQFVQFAKEVEALGLHGISMDVSRKSKVLTEHLCYHRYTFQDGILHKIKDIRFVLPYNVAKRDDGELLNEIHPQYQDAKFLICYSGSVCASQWHCAWTSCTMIERQNNPAERAGKDREVVYKQLQISRDPTPETVTKHVQNICNSITRKTESGPLEEQVVNLLKTVMTAVYEYFQIHQISNTIGDRLSSVSFIFLPDEGLFIRAACFVIDLNAEEVIEGYIYRARLWHYQFDDVFRRLGVAETPTATHFAMVLNTLKETIGTSEMKQNQWIIAQKSIRLLFKYLEMEGCTLNVDSLYLISEDRKLDDSKSLLFSDNADLKIRVISLQWRYVIGFDLLNMRVDNPVETISLLPTKYRPQVLSNIVTEELLESCRTLANTGDVSRRYLENIRSTEFISGLMRLLNHEECVSGQTALISSKGEEIEKQLLSMNIVDIPNVETVLVHDAEIVKDSNRLLATFIDLNSPCIYISTNLLSGNASDVDTCIAETLNHLTGGCLGTHILHLYKILQCTAGDIHKLLDRWRISAFNYIPKSTARPLSTPPEASRSLSPPDRTLFQPLGTIIPERFHFMLDNSVSSFTEGDYVGYEVYDPLIDDELEEEATEITHRIFVVYAILRKVVVVGNSPIMARYLIEGRAGNGKEVSATQLYKFIELSNDSAESAVAAPQDLETVLREVRRILKESWNTLDERGQHRVKKRLYLKWHPDKNPEQVEFCTEVCKCIVIYVDKLERGLDLDDEDIDVSACAGHTSPNYDWVEHVTERARRQRAYQDEYYEAQENMRPQFGGSFHDSTRSEVYPEPREARRWLRQAMADLDSVEENLRLSKAFNSVCFMCQQAAEKAIKSMWYNRDSRRADSIRSHYISSVVGGLENPLLAALASSLQNLVRDYNRLCYPDRLSYPRIPSDVEVYSEADAREAYRLAKEIVSLAKRSRSSS